VAHQDNNVRSEIPFNKCSRASKLFPIAASQRAAIASSFNCIDYSKNKHPFLGPNIQQDTRFYVAAEDKERFAEVHYWDTGPGQGFGVDFAVTYDPQAAGTPQGPGTCYWAGAAGTSFWIDPVNDMFWLSMIQAQGQRRPGAANMGVVARDIIYKSLEK